MQYLFLMLGYPGSGKSTFSALLAGERGMLRFNTDELRRYMFTTNEEIIDVRLNPYVMGALDYATDVTLKAGNSVIYDANHNSVVERKKLQQVADTYSVITIIVWLNLSLEIARDRETRRRLDPKYVAIPDARYEELAGLLEQPTGEELNIKINGEDTFSEQLQSFNDQLNLLIKQ